MMANGASETDACPCLGADTHFCGFDTKPIGVDDQYGEISIWICKKCGRNWLRYFIEYEYLTASGRVFTGVISPEAAAKVKAETAVDLFASMEWYFRGGSAFGKDFLRTTGPLQPWLIPFPGPTATNAGTKPIYQPERAPSKRGATIGSSILLHLRRWFRRR
jgi:hypothetical protein